MNWSDFLRFWPRPDDLKMRQTSRVCEPCACLEPQYGNRRFGSLLLHSETVDQQGEAWKCLEELIEVTVKNGSTEFSPGRVMPPKLWKQITTLPVSIAKLTSVKRLYLYGSNLVRLPPEIGAMQNLEELDIYTSYRLHWLPYEVTRCPNLKLSRASTRALYGNFKYRPPFPKLGNDSAGNRDIVRNCSVCNQLLHRESIRQVWITIMVATDVFPLLVNACSDECVERLPKPAQGYVDRPHVGGVEVKQPPCGFVPPL